MLLVRCLRDFMCDPCRDHSQRPTVQMHMFVAVCQPECQRSLSVKNSKRCREVNPHPGLNGKENTKYTSFFHFKSHKHLLSSPDCRGLPGGTGVKHLRMTTGDGSRDCCPFLAVSKGEAITQCVLSRS